VDLPCPTPLCGDTHVPTIKRPVPWTCPVRPHSVGIPMYRPSRGRYRGLALSNPTVWEYICTDHLQAGTVDLPCPTPLCGDTNVPTIKRPVPWTCPVRPHSVGIPMYRPPRGRYHVLAPSNPTVWGYPCTDHIQAGTVDLPCPTHCVGIPTP
jgi:hypothetical protein